MIAAVAAAGVFLAVVPGNPPGSYRDESSIAYNAYTIAQHGRDEYGATMPLFFRSFGDYKSPTYTYLLAAVFRVAGPSIEAARALSAVLGLLAVLGLGLVAARAVGSREVGAIVVLLAALTPWLFEVTRLVFEVALLPLAIVLFLLALQRAQSVRKRNAAELGLALGLVTYTYPAGRLLAPMFAVGLVLFLGRWRWQGLLRVWGVYVLTLVPLLVYSLRHPGALSSRFGVTTYVTPGTSAGGVVHEGVVNYLRDVSPWGWVVHGDPNERHHVHGLGGSLLLVVIVLAAAGIAVAVRRHRSDPWWRFVVFGLLVSPIPGTLTIDRMHSLRMVAFPIFLLLLAALTLCALLEEHGRLGRAAVAALVVLAVLQGALFQWQFRREGPHRGVVFEAAYPHVLDRALARRGRVYVFQDDHTYADALWYGVLRGESRRIVRLPAPPPPAGGTVVASDDRCSGCPLLAHEGRFFAYVSR